MNQFSQDLNDGDGVKEMDCAEKKRGRVTNGTSLGGKSSKTETVPKGEDIPSFCGANHHRSMARKHLGQPQVGLGKVPSLRQNCLNERPTAKKIVQQTTGNASLLRSPVIPAAQQGKI